MEPTTAEQPATAEPKEVDPKPADAEGVKAEAQPAPEAVSADAHANHEANHHHDHHQDEEKGDAVAVPEPKEENAKTGDNTSGGENVAPSEGGNGRTSEDGGEKTEAEVTPTAKTEQPATETPKAQEETAEAKAEEPRKDQPAEDSDSETKGKGRENGTKPMPIAAMRRESFTQLLKSEPPFFLITHICPGVERDISLSLSLSRARARVRLMEGQSSKKQGSEAPNLGLDL